MNNEYYGATLYQAIKEIEEGKMFLPAIQRKFVWDEDRITLLFDSIMKRYPIGTFLFWFLDKKIANEYVFYRFLNQYDERDPYNKKKTGGFTKDTIVGVLDGQQRLSSIFIGLQGTYTTKIKYKRYDNPDAWPERKLYLNLLSMPYEINNNRVDINEDSNFEFSFLDPKKVKNRVYISDDEKISEYWLSVGNIMKWPENPSWNLIYKIMYEEEANEKVKSKLKAKEVEIIKGIEDLYDRFRKTKIISYFKTEKKDLESILNIFVRVNSGAVILSKSDLLFSTIVATWEQGRKEIEDLQKKMNQRIGDGFNFSNDFIMRSLLVLSDLPVVYKVKSFKSDNVKNIKEDWDKISETLVKTVQLLSEYGLNGSLIPSQNAVIPLAYYIYKGGNLTDSAKDGLIKYLKYAFLKGTFGAQGDSVLSAIRKALTKNETDDKKDTKELFSKDFDFNDFLNRVKLPGNKSLNINDEDINDFLEYKKGTYTFLLLSLIYPNFKYGQVKLHQDHIHPYSMFKDSVYEELNLSKAEIMLWEERKNMLPNLQLIEGGENLSKNDTPFKGWLEKNFGNNDKAKKAYLEKNYIPKNEALDFNNFDSFFNKREEMIREELKRVLDFD